MAATRESLWETGHDESVEVNQRALIDKVLARYSGEFTVFRELLQNSDDAASKSVSIHFETRQYLDRGKVGTAASSASDVSNGKLPDLKTELVHQWTFKNDGMTFRDEDWSRLKKIAEGNPDEEKIGAFGVGFYSLFSITEEPFVTSGGQWMGFYWKDKKDQLFARRGTLPADPSASTTDPWTSFEMPLREPVPIPGAFDFTRFLASSITFMVHLRSISVFFDDKRLACLTKDHGVPRSLGIPKGMKTASPFSLMHVKGINSTPLHIKAEVMRWVYKSGSAKPPIQATRPALAQSGFFQSLLSSFSATPQRVATPLPPTPAEEADDLAVNETSVVLAIYAADVDVRLDKKMALELHRSTKKNPPNTLRVDLIYTGKLEYDASKQEDEKLDHKHLGSIFQGLRADLDGTGSARVFIGHATGQTTGLGGHLAARFIPTVERESIDLVDRNVSIWNKELLYVGGFLARAAYELELSLIRDLWLGAAESSTSSPDPELQTWLVDRALHALKFFTFHPSTPSSVVSNLLEAGFFSSSLTHPFNIMSSTGVRSIADVRAPDAIFSSFLKQLPVLPDIVLKGAPRMIDALRTRGLLKDITFADVLAELRARPLEEAELVACMRWWIGVQQNSNQREIHQAPADLARVRQELLGAALLATGVGTPAEKIVALVSVRTFVNPRTMGSIFPADGPFPEHTLPASVARNFAPNDLVSAFGWQELTLVEWLRHVSSAAVSKATPEFDICTSAVWAERVINALARAWPTLTKVHQTDVAVMLKDKTCVPTRSGMKVPEQAYFANANIFPDLPVVTMPGGTPIKGNLEKVLVMMGVRKHVDLQVVFDRMIKTGDWTIADLTKYLVAVQQTLTPVEMDRLRQTAAFPREASKSSVTGDQKPMAMARYKAGDLYEPLDIFRELQLPVIDWGEQTKWRPSSDEAKFLYLLGLRRFPPLPEILALAAGADEILRASALKYFIDNNHRYPEYDPLQFANVAFIPALQSDGKPIMGTPKDVFVEAESAVLGFQVVHPSVRDIAIDKLKLMKHPPTSMIVPLLEKSGPTTQAAARQWFEVLAGRLSEFTPAELGKLSHMAIVPAQQVTGDSEKSQASVRMMAPKDCYFKRDSNENFHSKLFVFVDFGTRANGFLSACGTKHEPSVEEIAQMLLSDPRRFYHLGGGMENYLTELRNIAVNRRVISHNTRTQMKRATVLLGSRRIKKGKPTSPTSLLSGAVDLDEEEWDLQYDLLRADQIVIADDTNAYQFFGDSVFSAPQEDLLEEFYLEMGSPRMSSLIREDYKTSMEIKDSKIGRDIRTLILERLPLFLHEHTHARTRVQFSWLNNDKHFIVRTFGKLTVTKHLNFGTTRLSRNQDASAASKRQGYGPIELWLAGNAQVDMYEVAISLCRVLFETPKVNDALLFMTILSTDLRALRRRGYNVDRILKQQKAEREAAEKTRREQAKEMEQLVSDPQPRMPGGMPSPMMPAPQAMPVPTPMPSPASAPAPAMPAPDIKRPVSPDPPRPPEYEPLMGGGKGARPASGFVNSLQSWRKKLGVRDSSEAGPSRPHSAIANGPTNTPQGGVTPLSNIASNIDQAIAACRPEQNKLLRNREEMQMVKESIEDGYCDVSGRVGDLTYVGSMADVKVYVSPDVADGRNILSAHHDAVARFIHVIRPLRALYKLPPTSIHIFFDHSGGTIAFNRNGSVFLNLRYYEAWHDADVSRSDLSKALISWFFTLAHEIAHNLVQPHNAEHEFWFSSICEAHVAGLGKLIAGAGKGAGEARP